MQNKPLRLQNRSRNTMSGQFKTILNRSSALSPSFKQSEQFFKTIISFEPKKYPFNNVPHQKGLHCKTFVHLDVTREQIIKNIPYICHQNLISVRKITRNYLSPSATKKAISYQIMYEYVPYSIKHVGFGHDDHQRIFKIVAKSDFRGIIMSLTDFLMRRKIYHKIKISNVGVTQQGQIKVYVSPQIICGSQYSESDKSSILKNNEKLINWWETTFNLSQISQKSSSKRSSEDVKPKKLFYNPVKHTKIQLNLKNWRNTYMPENQGYAKIDAKKSDQSDSLEKNKKNHNLFSTTFLSSSDSFKSQLIKINNKRNQKIRKINEQVKAIREKLNQKKKKLKISEHFCRSPSKKIQRESANVFDSERLERHLNLFGSDNKETKRYRETFQQNINCINIYNNSKQDSPRDIYSKPVIQNLSHYPVLSYSILPTQGITDQTPQTPQTPNLVLQKCGSFFDNPFDIDNQQSFDTYDIEMKMPEEAVERCPQEQTPSIDRQISEINFKQKHENQEQYRKKSNSHNQVETNNFTTSSAGPLQFKRFINQYIKPQFLAKKSNIYEDSMQYESQNSQYQTKPKLNNICRSIGSGTHSKKSSQLKKLSNSNQNNIGLNNAEIMLRILSENHLTYCNSYQKKFRQSTPFYESVQSKMRQIIERSKNALSIINKVKNAKSPDVRQRYASTLCYQ